MSYNSECTLPKDHELILEDFINIKPINEATSFHSAPISNFSRETNYSHHSYGKSSEWPEQLSWSMGYPYNNGGRMKQKKRVIKRTRKTKYALEAINTTPLNWHLSLYDDSFIHWDVLRYEYDLLSSQTGESKKIARRAFRAFVLVALTMIRPDRPSDLKTLEEANDFAMHNVAERIMLGNLLQFVSKNGGKKVAQHMANALFSQTWKNTGEGISQAIPSMFLKRTERNNSDKSEGNPFYSDSPVDAGEYDPENDILQFAADFFNGKVPNPEFYFIARKQKDDDNWIHQERNRFSTLLTMACSEMVLPYMRDKQMDLYTEESIGDFVSYFETAYFNKYADDAPGGDIKTISWIDDLESIIDDQEDLIGFIQRFVKFELTFSEWMPYGVNDKPLGFVPCDSDTQELDDVFDDSANK